MGVHQAPEASRQRLSQQHPTMWPIASHEPLHQWESLNVLNNPRARVHFRAGPPSKAPCAFRHLNLVSTTIVMLAATALRGPCGARATAATSAATLQSYSTTTTTSSTTPRGISCTATQWCSRDINCVTCFRALWPSLREAASDPAISTFEVKFLNTLRSTTACYPENIVPSLFAATLMEAHQNITCLAVLGQHSIDDHLGQVSFCQVFEYKCFVDSDCRKCLSNLYNASISTAHRSVANTLESSQCKATNHRLIADLSINCISFPTCTLSKQKCDISLQCKSCWATLVNGTNGAAAARDCPSGDAADTMNYLAGRCMSRTTASCDFFKERCFDISYCGECLSKIGDVNALSGTSSILRGLSTPSCRHTMMFFNAELFNVFRNCPGYTPCQRATAVCAISNDLCFECLSGTLQVDSDICKTVYNRTA